MYNQIMPTFESESMFVMFWVLAGIGGLLLFVFGLFIGRWIGGGAINRVVAQRERELFTAQKGFRQLYENEISQLKSSHARQDAELKSLKEKVEEYRKKAAGYGGLFGNNRRADAMYALLLENESLEEALMQKNEVLKEERDDALKEAMRAAGYRRVLMSQILADARVKQAVNDIVSDEKRLPRPSDNGETPRQLPH